MDELQEHQPVKTRSSFLIILLFLSVFVSLYQVNFAAASTPAGTITYNAGTDTITVIGANSTHPAEFLDLYNADVAGGWGQVTRFGSSYVPVYVQFEINCKLTIGNGTAAGTTYFTDTMKQITWGDALQSSPALKVTNSSTCTFGVVDDATTKRTSRGCSLIINFQGYAADWFLVDTGGRLNLYSCQVSTPSATNQHYIQANGDCYIWNSILSNQIALFMHGFNIYNSVISKTSYACSRVTGTIDKLTVSTASSAAFFANNGDGVNVSNSLITGASILQENGGTATDSYYINCESNTWTFTQDASCTAEIYRQYTFTLTVLNGEITDIVENANVTLTKNNVKLGSWLTNSSGQIPTQTLTYGFYNQTGGNTMYDGAYPFYLTITHTDWANYTSKFYCTEKTNWVVSMQNKTDTAVYQTIEQGNANMLIVALMVGLILAVLTVTIAYRRKN